MNADELLRHFERVADAPEALPRLRQLVLDLAVRGKLLPQQPGDASQTNALAAARSELGERAKATGRLRFTPSAPIAKAEIGAQLPMGWVAARVNDTGLYINGLAFKPSDWKASGLPIIRIQNLSDDSREFNYAQGEFADEVVVRTGDILVSWSATLDAYRWTRETGVLNQHIFRVIQATGLTDSGYLLLLLKRAIRDLSESVHAHGLVMTHINRGPFLNHVVWIPPLAEQRRIVAKVDELMALCDGLEAARAEREAVRDRLTAASLARLNTPDPETFSEDARFVLGGLRPITTRSDQIKQLRLTILALAVSGNLTRQDPIDGDGSAGVGALKKARAQWESAGRIRKEKTASAPVSEDEKYLVLPASWTWVRLLDIGQTQTGTSPSSSNPDLFGDFMPFLKPGDLDGNSITYSGPGLSEVGVDHSRLAPAESVLMVCIGATLGKVNKTTRPACFNQQINAVTPFVDGIADYVAMAIKSQPIQALAWSRAGTGTLPIISKGKWEQLPIPFPPLAEQRRIVAKVDELMTVCDRLEASLLRAEDQRRRLLESLLHEALAREAVHEEAA